MKKLIFWASALLLVGAVASCEPQTPQEPENLIQPESPLQPDTPAQPENPNIPDDSKIPANYNDLFEMIYIEGGTFQMGATEEQVGDAWVDEKPVHVVSLSSFYLSKTEVTQGQYKAVMGKNPSYFKGDNLPVETVRWYDAQDFCKKLSQLTGKHYVLPTEAQWEYAARGGKYNEKTKYAGSNNVGQVAWYGKDCDNGSITPVATKIPNILGLYDMSGSVWEWCADRYGPYLSNDQTNPTGSESGAGRVIRGGCWYNVANRVRVSARYSADPFAGEDFSIGFRIAMIP